MRENRILGGQTEVLGFRDGCEIAQLPKSRSMTSGIKLCARGIDLRLIRASETDRDTLTRSGRPSPLI